MPLLTVGIPVYNVEKYLRECLDSIVNQTYTNLEIIIVNDCSPDNSEEIILEYQAKDPRIKYIKHEKNLGLGGARNTVIQNATGEWIAFVDSDDYIELDTYETMIDLILKNNVNLAMFRYIGFDDATKKENPSNNNYYYISTITKLNFRESIKHPPSACNKIFKLSDITDNNLYFPEHLKFEDFEFWCKYTSIVEPTVIGCDKKFYHYRQRSDSIIGSANTHMVDKVHIIKNVYSFLIDKNLFDENKDIFFRYAVKRCYLDRHIPLQIHIKLLSIFHDFLQQFPDEDLLSYPELFAVKNLPIDERYMGFLTDTFKVQELQNDKWYRFGQLPRKDKIKTIVKKLLKR